MCVCVSLFLGSLLGLLGLSLFFYGFFCLWKFVSLLRSHLLIFAFIYLFIYFYIGSLT